MDEDREDIPKSEKDTGELDDIVDRDELRHRFDMLLQELRVVLPGVQVLLAFLLTAPFSQRFAEVDTWGRRAYAVALATAMLAVIALLTPTILHRLVERTARTHRLWWSIRLLVVGLVLVAVALVSAMWGIARFVFGTTTSWWLVTPALIVLGALWLILPFTLRRRRPTAASEPT